MSLILFAIVLSILVFVHEFCHFLAAKKSGVDVEEFGFGLPPRLFGKKFKGTIYSINLLPVGGFVRLKGESGETLGFGDQGSFESASKKNRVFIITAGVLGNLIFAFFIFLFLYIAGYPRFVGQVIIDGINKDSPAEKAGIKTGDTIVKVDRLIVDGASDLVSYTTSHKEQGIELTIVRDGQQSVFSITPRANPPSGEGPLGVKLMTRGSVVYDKYSIIEAPLRALKEVGRSVYLVLFGFFGMLRTLFSFNVPQGVTGVVGIYKLTQEASGIGFRVLLQFVALLSVNLFVFNILPLPALDGGRLLFIFIETIFKKKISPRIENTVNSLGLAILLAIFVLITISDIRRYWG